jgi:hypothetical protein
VLPEVLAQVQLVALSVLAQQERLVVLPVALAQSVSL